MCGTDKRCIRPRVSHPTLNKWIILATTKQKDMWLKKGYRDEWHGVYLMHLYFNISVFIYLNSATSFQIETDWVFLFKRKWGLFICITKIFNSVSSISFWNSDSSYLSSNLLSFILSTERFLKNCKFFSVLFFSLSVPYIFIIFFAFLLFCFCLFFHVFFLIRKRKYFLIHFQWREMVCL